MKEVNNIFLYKYGDVDTEPIRIKLKCGLWIDGNDEYWIEYMPGYDAVYYQHKSGKIELAIGWAIDEVNRNVYEGVWEFF